MSDNAEPHDELVVRPMESRDLPGVLQLWERTEGISHDASEGVGALERFLRRNPGLSAVARHGGEVVGAVLCGHDGRRAYLARMAVAPDHRRRGLGRQMVQLCLEALRHEGIDRCNLLIYDDNQAARDFWARLGWELNDSVRFMTRKL